jgi:hypothetical protein
MAAMFYFVLLEYETSVIAKIKKLFANLSGFRQFETFKTVDFATFNSNTALLKVIKNSQVLTENISYIFIF